MSQEGARSLVKHDQRKEALSDVPRNQREVIKLPKFEAVVTNIIEVPKENINGNTRLELYFFPTISRNGAVRRQAQGLLQTSGLRIAEIGLVKAAEQVHDSEN
ncbi:MAG: hypothetical protein Q9201_000515 [Fulgogasparrea decipioides]